MAPPLEIAEEREAAGRQRGGVVVRPQTWLGILFPILAFPLGLFYFVFLVTDPTRYGATGELFESNERNNTATVSGRAL